MQRIAWYNPFRRFSVVCALNNVKPDITSFTTLQAFKRSHKWMRISQSRPFHTQTVALLAETNTSGSSPATHAITTSNVQPLIVETEYSHPYLPPPVAWIESMNKLEDDDKKGFITLSPNVWFQSPRIDVLFEVIKWQTTYKKLLVKQDAVRSELKGGTKKPWPQKGTGRARFKDDRGPGWIRGGIVWGARGPRSYYYMLPTPVRVKALQSALSIKLAQDDLHVVDSFNSLPSNLPSYLEALATKRNWGLSILFVDDNDIMPTNTAEAAWDLDSFTLMPVYGLNVYSILKHETLVMTVAAVRRLEEKLKFFQIRAVLPEKNEVDRIHNTGK